MNTIRIKQVDAFTRTPFCGNPAGVVLEAEGLSTRDMQHIAREMNVSETVFVLPPSNPDTADVRLRWFTPSQEVDLCGHATIAAFHALAEEGMFDLEVDEPQSFLVETKSGELTVDVEWQDLRPYVKFSLPLPRFFPYPGDIRVLAGALGLSEIELSTKVRPQITQNGYCFVPLHKYDSLETIEPSVPLLKKLKEQYDLVGFAVVTTDTAEKNVDWEMRFFAPALGVPEDPVTGSAHGPMAAFLWYSGLLDKSKKVLNFRGGQGKYINRPGLVHVTLLHNGKSLEELQIAGEAITVLDGTMLLKAETMGDL
jgi:PhzF family phenazine biosynthesis protein